MLVVVPGSSPGLAPCGFRNVGFPVLVFDFRFGDVVVGSWIRDLSSVFGVVAFPIVSRAD
jgi:hypothetical protein